MIILLLVVISLSACETGEENPDFQPMVSSINSGEFGYEDGPIETAKFESPVGTALDNSGNMYVAEKSRIRLISKEGVVTTFAGSDEEGYKDGIGQDAVFNFIGGIALAKDGTLYVTESRGNRVRKITPDQVVTTIAGDGEQGYMDGKGTEAQFNGPGGIVVSDNNIIYVADVHNHLIRKITQDGMVTTLAGNGELGYADGTGTAAILSGPLDVTIDEEGKIWFVDSQNHMIRTCTQTGVVNTIAGDLQRNSGFAAGIGPEARFLYPLGITTIGKMVYIVDAGNNRICTLDSNNMVTTFAGDSTAGFKDGPLSEALFSFPYDIQADQDGNLYVTDVQNNRIRKIQMQ